MIRHIKCNIFESGADIICHQVNCQGIMGSGVAKQVREKYPEVFQKYKASCQLAKDNPSGLLGGTQWIVTSDGIIVNLFAQENFGYDGKCYTDYKALKRCLKTVHLLMEEEKQKTIAFPYLMGCHRGGGSWDVVYKIIEEVFAYSDCEVLICEYNGG